MSNDFNLCPMCGSKSIKFKDNKKWFCSDCGFDLYCNVAAAVGVVISDKENNVLFEVRAKNPRKGFLAFPGGFVDGDERAEDGVVRECQEEIGAEVKDIEFLCTFPNTYEYKNITYKTCDIFFTARLDSEEKNMDELIKNLQRQESEVTDFVSVHIGSEDDIEKIPLAFESARKTLKIWYNKKVNK